MNTKKLFTLLIVFACAAAGGFAQQPTPQWRPVYHFTPQQNWTNDPNGLVYFNGEYHLYYQHNPFENKWGHMSWGHATSKDLLHWQHLPVAVPEIVGKDTTTWIYSGSVVLDKANTSGFGEGGRPPLVAAFTADQPKQRKESQFIAYSNDGGRSYKLYDGNPVIDLDMRDFRDPNVFWHEQTGQWIMVVAMVDQHQVRLYGSKDLKTWTKLSDFGPAGYTKHGWECPSILPVKAEGQPGKTKWVMLVSSGGDHGPLMQYFVGDFDGTTFKNDNPDDMVLTVDFGDAFYAAIAWRDAPANVNILLGWLQAGQRETFPWKGQMSVPRDLYLKATDEGLRLIQKPSAVVSKSIAKTATARSLSKRSVPLYNETMSLSSEGKFNTNSNWIDAEFELSPGSKAGFNIAEKKDGSKKVVVGYDEAKQELFVDCTSSEQGAKSQENLVMTAPLKKQGNKIKLTVLLDKSSLEVFGNDGERVISTMIYPDNDATGVSVFAGGRVKVSSLKMSEIKL